MFQFDASWYTPFFLYTLLAITLMYFISMFNKGSELIDENSNNPIFIIYVIVFTLIAGWRPPSGIYFGDSYFYAFTYENFMSGKNIYDPNSKEWFFYWMMSECSKIMNRADFFLLVECLYIFPVLLACKRFVPNHYCLMFVFCMGAFSFFTYGVNGIRNGMACSLIIMAISFVNSNIIGKIIAGVLAFIAFNMHRSTALPIISFIAAYFIKDTKYVIKFWIFSIFISLVASGPVEAFFTGLGFDDRMSAYSSANAKVESSMFSSIGFRWDFLLYSAMPIWLGYYVVLKRKIYDNNYLLILNTYILCNAFWVMMIRSSYSNRFAYLSWFLYALVLSYPLLKFEIWEDQGKKLAYILMGHFLFTFIME